MITTLLLLASPAFAWRHTGLVWDIDNDFPRTWYVDDDSEDSLEDVDSTAVLQKSWDAWETAPCANVSDDFAGTTTTACPDSLDGLTMFFWDDPCDEMAPGVLGVTYSQGTAYTRTIGGRTYKLFYDTDIIYNNDIFWDTPEQIEQSCVNAYDIQGVSTHEIGHSYGIGHSCEQGESCPDSVLADATMFWSVSSCDTSQSDINQDDIDAITALYGLAAGFTATSDRYGGTPFDVSFEIEQEGLTATLLSASWNFGDGGTSTDLAPVHTYESENQYTVSVDFVLNTEECGDVEYKDVRLGYVLACEPPAWAEGASGFFQVAKDDGLTYKVLNHTDVSTYGCVDTIEWKVYKGTSAADATEANLVLDVSAWTPSLTFPSEGSYVVVMTVGGPGGIQASSLVVNATSDSGGCNTAPAAGIFGLFGLLALRRRRS